MGFSGHPGQGPGGVERAGAKQRVRCSGVVAEESPTPPFAFTDESGRGPVELQRFEHRQTDVGVAFRLTGPLQRCPRIALPIAVYRHLVSGGKRSTCILQKSRDVLSMPGKRRLGLAAVPQLVTGELSD